MTDSGNPAAMHAVKLPGQVWLLALAQGVNLTVAVIAVSVAALAGLEVAPSPAWATLPFGAQFGTILLLTWPASAAMARFGRKPVFLLGGILLVACGGLGYAAMNSGSFLLLTATHALLGAYAATANFTRFAAVDGLEGPLRARALSLVVAGGVAAAVLGPLIAINLREITGQALFAGCYAAIAVLGLASIGLMTLWTPPAAPSKARTPGAQGGGGILTRPVRLQLAAAIAAAASAYLIMSLLMIQASLVMRHFADFTAASHAIQLHVLAMFLPSFFTGKLIARLGLRPVLLAGFGLLAGSLLLAVLPPNYPNIVVALILLGLGWNFAYIGGGALLAQAAPEQVKHRWQGINDTVIAACATAGAFLPAPLLTHAGWTASNLLMLPVCLAVTALCWTALAARPGKQPA